ncbi:MAG: DUF1565 domain-containing protein [Bacteroidales bacterium]|nr:DUF1565 domain-containing protein [Bacteroidales bacterium]
MKTNKLILLLSVLFIFTFQTAMTSQISVNSLKNKAKSFKTKSNSETNSSSVSNTSSNSTTESKNETVSTNNSGTAKIIYVSKSGSNKNDGTKSSPLKNIDKAVQKAMPGDKIYIAEGIYNGTFGVGYIETDKPLKLYGSWDSDFTGQDIINHPSIFQPDNARGGKGRKALLRFTKEVDGTFIDNIVWDMGERNCYDLKDGFVEGVEGGRIRRSSEPLAGKNSTVEEPCISIRSGTLGGDVCIQNCVFVNGASFGIQAAHKSGLFKVLNNVFVANRMAAVEIFGTCAGSKEKANMVACGDVEIANNTVLFTWSRLKDFGDMGYGIRIMTKLKYNIHHNIIGANIMGGIDNSRFCKDEYVKIDNNIFFGNKGGDLEYYPASNVELKLNVDEFEDLEFESVSNNKSVAPPLSVNQAYLKGFFKASYSETTNYDPNSAENQWARALGMNQQGTMSSKVSMFMNKYPWKETLQLFGMSKEAGAQKP